MNETLSVKEYNARQRIKYKQRCQEWKPGTGGFPQIAFYVFLNEDGSLATKGTVKINGHKHEWIRPTTEAKKLKLFLQE